jgi:diguanylate cyclase (GGDEF)-like protein
LGAIIYYLVAMFGMSVFSFHPSNITLLWLPFGIGVILTHHFGLKALPFIFLGSFFANYGGMVTEEIHSIFHTSIASFADTLAPFLSTWLIRRHMDGNCDGVKVLLPITIFGAIIPTFISGVIISLNLAIGGYIHYDEVYALIGVLMFADGLGLLLLYPIYQNFKILSVPTLKEWQVAFFYLAVAFAFIWFSFTYNYFLFLVLPLLLIAAFQIRIHLLMGMLLMIVIETIALSAHSNGVFHMPTQIESILMLITYLMSLVFVIMGVSLHHTELINSINLINTDNLTKVKNVRAYKERILELLSLYERYQTPFSILIFDIDDFKVVNDTYGHRVGDIVLTDMCALIQKHIRTNDTLFRVGGEEFVILCPNTYLIDAVEIAEKVREVVALHLNTIDNKSITISVGVSQVEVNDTEDSLYRRVDGLLYKSKHNGKNIVTSDYIYKEKA